MKTSIFRVKDICRIKSGKRLPAGFDFSPVPTPFRYIRSRDIKNGKINLDSIAYIDAETKRAIDKYIINDGDIAITIVANIGDVGFATKECDGVNLTENAVRLTSFNQKIVFPKYLSYYLKLPFMKSYMENMAAGAAQAKLGIYKIESMKVQLPDLPIQKTVVRIIEKYDNLIEINDKRIKVLEQMAENLYKEWFVRFRFPGYETAEFENGIPHGWKYKRADEAIIFNPTLKVGNQKRFIIIPMEALSTTSMVLDSTSFIEQDFISGRRSQNGDTLFAKITPCLENGKTGFVMGMPESTVFGGSTEFVVMRSKTLTPHYVYSLARSEFFRQTAILSMNGADGRQRVDEEKLKATKILQPDNVTLNLFEKKVTPIFDVVNKIVLESKNLIKQRDLILPRLMCGKLEV
ncbi:MAG: restriction endonuclease subunit S [Clostridia bacterium]|nr:restriction endonuclease subunit S [Clostridia bacterium]